MTSTSSFPMPFEKLPLINLAAPKVLSRRSRAGNTATTDGIAQDANDAETILKIAGLDLNLLQIKIVQAAEKYMIATQPDKETAPSAQTQDIGMRQRGLRRPHYTRLLVFDTALVFQAACCLPLKIIAASLNGNPVCGRILYNGYSENGGGKIVYEFQGSGAEIIIDLMRGENTRTQRHVFRGMK